MKVVYGIDIDAVTEDYATMFEEAIEGPHAGLEPGRFLVEFLPFLRYIPPWLPGTSSQKLFLKWQAAGNRLKNEPYHRVAASMV